MKKSILFIFFVIFFIAGVCLPNSLFATPDMGYLFCAIFLLFAQILYLLVLIWNTKSLFSLPEDNDSILKGTLILLSVAGIAISMIAISFTLGGIVRGGISLYVLSITIIVIMLLLTTLFIFISHDVTNKK